MSPLLLALGAMCAPECPIVLDFQMGKRLGSCLLCYPDM
jgi:hypothetical protein